MLVIIGRFEDKKPEGYLKYEKRTNYHIETCVDCGFSMNAVHTYGAYTFEFRDITYTQQRCIYCGQKAS